MINWEDVKKKSIEVTNGAKKEIVTVSYKYDEFDNITKSYRF